MTHDPNRTALVLSGGGAYGAFAVGALKTLFAGRSPSTGYQPLVTGILTGTSVGAFNAAVLAENRRGDLLARANALENIWTERIAERPGQCGSTVFRLAGNPSDYFDPSCLRSPDRVAKNFFGDGFTIGRYVIERTANFLASDLSLPQRMIGLANLGSFIDNSPFREMLGSVISEQNIFASDQRVQIVATDWIAGKAVRFENADFKDGLGLQAILASSAVPGVFPAVHIGARVFVDGGVIENTPLKPALELGARELHVIYLDPRPQYVPLLGEPNTLDTLMRVYHIMLATKLNEDIETARWINSGLEALAGAGGAEQMAESGLRDIVRVAGKFREHGLPYRPVTIHRYFPQSAVGTQIGAFEFTADTISKMIREGERVALLHDCAQNGCVLAPEDRQVRYA